MKNRYNIALSKSDKLIACWKRKALQAKQEEMSTLVRNAVLNFIETGTFLDIGHIHFNPEEETVTPYDCIVLQTARTPLVREWIEANDSAGLGIGGPIKVLLNECIKVIAEDEKEWFPPPSKGVNGNKSLILNEMLKTANKVTGRNLDYTNISRSPRNTLSARESVLEQKSTPVREQTVSGEHKQIVSSLNSLLPQRAKKK